MKKSSSFNAFLLSLFLAFLPFNSLFAEQVILAKDSVCIANKVNVRSGYGDNFKNYDVLYQLSQGDKVEIISEDNGWCQLTPFKPMTSRMQTKHWVKKDFLVDIFLVTPHGIGPISPGMTISQAAKMLPFAKFERTEDGEGIQYVDVFINDDHVMELFADEDHGPIQWDKRILVVSTSNSSCHTPDGIHPGSKIKQCESILGNVESITQHYDPDTQRIRFIKQPKEIAFEISYEGGVFRNGEHTTNKFKPDSTIETIFVSGKAR